MSFDVVSTDWSAPPRTPARARRVRRLLRSDEKRAKRFYIEDLRRLSLRRVRRSPVEVFLRRVMAADLARAAVVPLVIPQP